VRLRKRSPQDQERLWDNAAGSLNRKQMGNVIGQQRSVARLQKAAGDLLLDVKLHTGKRGRYNLEIAIWLIFDPVTNGYVSGDRPFPFAACPAVAINVSSGRKEGWAVALPLVISRHAVIRLAQRANVRTTAELLSALGSLWRAVRALIDGRREDWMSPPDGVWLLPFVQGDDSPFAVLEPDRSGDRRLVCKTIYEPGW
jgi:hypothetical protein